MGSYQVKHLRDYSRYNHRARSDANRKQIVRLQVEYPRLARDGDPRALGPAGEPFADDRAGRLAWARAHLGAPRLASFKDLTELQAEYLLDILSGKRTKLDGKLNILLSELKVRDREAWFAAFQDSRRNVWKFKRCRLCDLNRHQKIELVSILDTRVDY